MTPSSSITNTLSSSHRSNNKDVDNSDAEHNTLTHNTANTITASSMLPSSPPQPAQPAPVFKQPLSMAQEVKQTDQLLNSQKCIECLHSENLAGRITCQARQRDKNEVWCRKYA